MTWSAAGNSEVHWWTLPSPAFTSTTSDGAISPAFSPDGRIMATISTTTGAVQLWNVRRRMSPVPPGALPGGAVAYSPLGHILATDALWDTDSAPPRLLSRLPDEPVAFSRDGRLLATTAACGTSVARPGPIGCWRSRIAAVPALATQVAFVPAGQVLATMTFGGSVRLWDVTDPARPRPMATFAGTPVPDARLLVSPDGATIALPGPNSTTRLWNTAGPPASRADRRADRRHAGSI